MADSGQEGGSEPSKAKSDQEMEDVDPVVFFMLSPPPVLHGLLELPSSPIKPGANLHASVVALQEWVDGLAQISMPL